MVGLQNKTTREERDVTKTGNGEPGTGVWERVYSSNPPKNSTGGDKGKEKGTIWENVRKCYGCKL